MYLAYKTTEQYGDTFFEPIGILKNKDDKQKFELICGDEKVNYEKIDIVNMDEVKPIVYIDFTYYTDGRIGCRKVISNTLLKSEKDCNTAYTLTNSVHITKVINANDDIDMLKEKLIDISRKFLMMESLEELHSNFESGIKTNSLYMEIDVNDLFEKFL